MKKKNTILFLLVGIISMCCLNFYSVHAHQGNLQKASLKTCPNGIQYGYHNCKTEACTEKGHWHQVGIKDNGPELSDPCPDVYPIINSEGKLVKSKPITTTAAPASPSQTPQQPSTPQTTKSKTTTKATTQKPEETTTTEMITEPATEPQSEKITISFDTNGGIYISPVTISIGEKITLPVPTREDYEFEGWYNKSGLTKITENYDFTYSTTIYAKWKEEAKKYDEQTETKTQQTSSDVNYFEITIFIFIVLSAGYIGFCIYKMRKK